MRIRSVLRPALVSLLLVAGSAQASSCLTWGSAEACSFPDSQVMEITLPPFVAREPVQAETLPALDIIEKWYDSQPGEAREQDRAEQRWTHAAAMEFVHDWARRHRDEDFEDFRRYWRRNLHGHHGHHGDGDGCHDDDLPKPVPLPGAALLFAPALLMLRAAQRRNA